MFFSGIFRGGVLAAVIFFWLPAVVSSAEYSGLLKNLPRHSAMVTGVDFSALKAHGHGAEVFRIFREKGGRAAELFARAVFACDSQGKRCVSLFSPVSGEIDEVLIKQLAHRLMPLPLLASDERCFYQVTGVSYGGKAVYISAVDRLTAAIYAGYPVNIHPGSGEYGIDPVLKNILPLRKDVFVFGAGHPRLPEYPLNTIRRFEFALENDAADELRFHGQIFYRNSLDAALAEKFMPGALMFLLERRFQVPPAETGLAWDALKFQRQGNILHFSGSDLPPVINVLGKVLKSSAGSYEAVIK